MKKKFFLFFKIISALAFLLSSCQSLKIDQKKINFQKEDFIPQEYEWNFLQNEASGIETAFFENKNIPLKYCLVKINLKNPDLGLCLFPEQEYLMSKNFSKSGYFSSMRTKDFAKKNNLLVAVNAGPFKTKSKISSLISKKRKILGIYKNQNKILSDSVQKYSALSFSKVKSEEGIFYVPQIFQNQNNSDFSNEEIVLGAFFTILKNSQIIQGFSTEIHDARTAAGFDSEKNFFYILVCEKSAQSKGLSYPECAEIFKNLNCSDALEFDGGSSSELAIMQNGILKTFPQNKIIVTQAASFGFYLDNKNLTK